MISSGSGSDTDFFDCETVNVSMAHSGFKRSSSERNSPHSNSPEFKVNKMDSELNTSAESTSEMEGATANPGPLDSVNVWLDTFSEEKGYPGFAAKFAEKLNAVMIPSMRDNLIPAFAKEAQKIFSLQSAPIKRDVENLGSRVDCIMHEMVGLRLKTNYVKSMTRENRDAILKLDAERRMNNLLFVGIEESYNEKADDLIRKINAQISKIPDIDLTKVVIQRCYRLGKRSNFRPREVLVQFLDYQVKQRVSKGREHFSERVKVRQDLPPQLASIQRALMPIKLAAERLPQYKNKVFVSLGELRIGDDRYTLKNLEEIPSDINYGAGTFKANARFYLYFGVLSIFSNFRWAPIQIDNIMFEMNEKYIQYCKAKLFGDETTLVEIYEEDNPFIIKKLGYSVKGYKKAVWERKLEEVAYTCNRRKYDVHHDFAEFLINTYPRDIAEASEEEPWGCGVRLSNEDALDPNTWSRRNGVMGNILMKIRLELIEEKNDMKSRRCGTPRSTDV